MGARYCAAHKRLKVCYDSEEQALMAIEDVGRGGRRRAKGQAGKRPRRAYPCGDHWHITSLEKPPR